MDDRPHPWWRRYRVIVPVAVLLLLLGALLIWRGCHKAAAAEEAANIVVSVQVAKAERGAIANDISTVATLVPKQQADVMPKVSAQIKELPLLLNRSVHAGDVLVVLEGRDLNAQLAEARAAVTENTSSAKTTASGLVPLANAQDAKAVRDAQATVDNARKTYERRKVLFGEGGISKKELEASQLAVTLGEDDLRAAESASALHHRVTNPGDVTVANAKAQQARARLTNLEAQLGYTTLRAPFAGIVTAQYQHQGDFATPGTKILSVADASTLIAKMNVAEATAATLRVGDVAKVLADELPNEPFTGTIALVGSGADMQSRSVEVWVMVPNASGRLRANGLARVALAAQATTSAIVVPTAAVTLDATNGNSGTVMVVDAQSVAHEVHVTTGIRSAARTQILAGLSGGETVVTEGNYGLPDGTKVALAGAEPKQNAPTKAPADADD